MQGIKPASLGKVNDPQVKQFIEKCLVPASMRLPAIELLKDPFLAIENPKELIPSPLALPKLVPKQENVLQSESHSMDIDNCLKKLSTGSCAKSNGQAQQHFALEFERCSARNEFRLSGEKNDDETISLTLRIADQCGGYICF